MRVVFFGTPDFAVATLEALAKNHSVAAVISQPDKPKGRGKKLQPTPVKAAAQELGIPVYQPEKIKDDDFLVFLESLYADVFVVVAYGQILSERILNIPKYGCINVHGSLLPKYRGASPIQKSIIDGEKVTGVTIMYMAKSLDSGDMILKKKIAIDDDDTYGTLHDKMAPIGAQALIEALKLIEDEKADPVKQDESLSTYVGKITKEMGEIDWSRSSNEIRNQIRGFNPAPGAYSFMGDNILKIYNADIQSGYDLGSCGEVVAIDRKKGFVVKTGDGALMIKEVQAKGGKRMNAADYMRGHSISVGELFGRRV